MSKLIEIVDAVRDLYGVGSVVDALMDEDGEISMSVAISMGPDGWYAIDVLTGMGAEDDLADEDGILLESHLTSHYSLGGEWYSFMLYIDAGVNLDTVLGTLREHQEPHCPDCADDSIHEIEQFLASVDGTP